MYDDAEKIQQLIEDAKTIVVIQADNPDADSLGSALSLEALLDDLGKVVSLYCAVTMPSYLHYLKGWDRVQNELIGNFDLSIVVDASTSSLLDKLLQNQVYKSQIVAKPSIVLDHHKTVTNIITFASVMINDDIRASTGELIYCIAAQLHWKLPVDALTAIMASILGDTQGLTNQLATAQTYRIMADMIDGGINRPEMEELRRSYSKMPLEIYQYKALLIQQTQFEDNNAIAFVIIGQSAINKYSPLYNPAPLIQSDMLQIADVRVAIVFKKYDDGRITAAIRCNQDAPIAADLAEFFGGGGHAYASGFKIVSGKSIQEIKTTCIEQAIALLKVTRNGSEHEAAQYSY